LDTSMLSAMISTGLLPRRVARRRSFRTET
jgi:hypothetical protein